MSKVKGMTSKQLPPESISKESVCPKLRRSKKSSGWAKSKTNTTAPSQPTLRSKAKKSRCAKPEKKIAAPAQEELRGGKEGPERATPRLDVKLPVWLKDRGNMNKSECKRSGTSGRSPVRALEHKIGKEPNQAGLCDDIAASSLEKLKAGGLKSKWLKPRKGSSTSGYKRSNAAAAGPD